MCNFPLKIWLKDGTSKSMLTLPLHKEDKYIQKEKALGAIDLTSEI